jgi:uncharacterized protein YjbJ (UPF0337 family)
VGNLTGATTWQQSGREEAIAGEAEINAAKAKGYVEGTMDRVEGKKDSVVGAITGDRQQEASGTHSHQLRICFFVFKSSSLILGNVQHDKGQAQQTFNKNY